MPEACVSVATGLLALATMWGDDPLRVFPVTLLLIVMSLGFGWSARGADGAAMGVRWVGIGVGLVAAAWWLWFFRLFLLSE